MEGSTGQTTERKPMAGQEKSNYRPVSNLSFISKVAEKVTLMQLTEHCDEKSYYLHINPHTEKIIVVRPAW